MTSRNCIVLDNAPDVRGVLTGLRCQGMTEVSSSENGGAFSFSDPGTGGRVLGLLQNDEANGTSKVFLFAEDGGMRPAMEGLGSVFGGEIVLEDGVSCSERVSALAAMEEFEAEAPAPRF